MEKQNANKSSSSCLPATLLSLKSLKPQAPSRRAFLEPGPTAPESSQHQPGGAARSCFSCPKSLRQEPRCPDPRKTPSVQTSTHLCTDTPCADTCAKASARARSPCRRGIAPQPGVGSSFAAACGQVMSRAGRCPPALSPGGEPTPRQTRHLVIQQNPAGVTQRTAQPNTLPSPQVVFPPHSRRPSDRSSHCPAHVKRRCPLRGPSACCPVQLNAVNISINIKMAFTDE